MDRVTGHLAGDRLPVAHPWGPGSTEPPGDVMVAAGEATFQRTCTLDASPWWNQEPGADVHISPAGSACPLRGRRQRWCSTGRQTLPFRDVVARRTMWW